MQTALYARRMSGCPRPRRPPIACLSQCRAGFLVGLWSTAEPLSCPDSSRCRQPKKLVVRRNQAEAIYATPTVTGHAANWAMKDTLPLTYLQHGKKYEDTTQHGFQPIPASCAYWLLRKCSRKQDQNRAYTPRAMRAGVTGMGLEMRCIGCAERCPSSGLGCL